MASGTAGRKRRITFIESDEKPEAVRKAYAGKELVEVELFVRKPDNTEIGEFAVAARLCSCRRVCLAFLDAD
jgi:hypothetical protein